MRTILRAGAITGGVWFVALFVLQTAAGLLVTLGIVAAGLCAGLATAKWLERPWFGRQLVAGLRAGLLASGLAAAAALLSLLILGPHDVATLATHSRLFSLSAAATVHALGFAGWIGADVLGVLLAFLAAVALAAATTQVFAWSKNAKAIRVVAQARLAAQALNREEDWRQNTTGAPSLGQGIHASVLLNQLAVPGYGGTLLPASTPPSGLVPPAFSSPSAPQSPMPIWPAAMAAPSLPASASQVPAAEGADASATDRPAARVPSQARPAEKQLTQAMREALAAWATDAQDDAAADEQQTSREPQPSAFLNGAAPSAKRNRKKNNTRDWLC